MKQLKIIVLIFFLIFFLTKTDSAFAVNGDACNEEGGTCRLICFSDETGIGSLDCPSEIIEGSQQQETCCKKGHSGCKGDNFDCEKNEECCSKKCEYDSHQNKTICKSEVIDTFTPYPTINATCPGHPDQIKTAIGCVPVGDLNEFAGWLLGKIIFVASGIAFLLMAFGAFQIITSAGSPEKAKAGSELITSALSGLLFIILSVFLLKLIGVDILHIPGL